MTLKEWCDSEGDMADEPGRKPNCRLHCGGTHNDAPNFCFELEDLATGRSLVFVQTDWDYPGLARHLGWDMRKLQCSKSRRRDRGVEGKCDHDGTDGTVECECGLTPGEFISAAYDWLSEHDNEEFECHDYDEYLEPEDADG